MVSPGAHQRDIEVDAVVGKTLTSKLVVADIIAEAPPKSLFVCLSRNWWWKQLGGNELEVEGTGFLFEPFNSLEPELALIVFDAF